MLIFEDKVKTNRDAFIGKVQTISANLGINPNWLMYIMYKESGLNPQARNTTGGATGLIQFMPSTARSLGTTTDALSLMSNVQQLDYVYKYFKNAKGKFNSIHDLYLYNFYPYAIGKPLSYVFGSERSLEWSKTIKKQNPGIGIKGKDTISLGEYYDWKDTQIIKNVPTEFISQFKKKT